MRMLVDHVLDEKQRSRMSNLKRCLSLPFMQITGPACIVCAVARYLPENISGKVKTAALTKSEKEQVK